MDDMQVKVFVLDAIKITNINIRRIYSFHSDYSLFIRCRHIFEGKVSKCDGSIGHDKIDFDNNTSNLYMSNKIVVSKGLKHNLLINNDSQSWKLELFFYLYRMITFRDTITDLNFIV